jgi:hypothetical protein
MVQNWSTAEIDACFSAYLDMYKAQQAHQPFVKAEITRTLLAGALHQRTRSSLERRFQNYSHLFEQRGLAWVQGYAPLAHVGVVVRERVNLLIDKAGLNL